ncbi:MAG: PilZ domain-containing protein [Candidatus Omnitrophica bacterium]|nr:PilZ domain-containing protein [Candidatus Omnitrophota bacterium]
MENERRKSPRVKKYLVAYYSKDGRHWNLSHIRDFSETGLMITTQGLLTVGDTLEFHTKIPFRPFDPIRFSGKVVYSSILTTELGEFVTDTHLTRVELVDMNDEHKELVHKYIDWFLNKRKKVLFVCASNPTLSQMAEAWLSHYASDLFEVFSASIESAPVDPMAVTVMGEIGIDIKECQPRPVSEFTKSKLDYVIMLCDKAKENCPDFEAEHKAISWHLNDPAEADKNIDRLQAFKNLRDNVKDKVKDFINSINVKARF